MNENNILLTGAGAMTAHIPPLPSVKKTIQLHVVSRRYFLLALTCFLWSVQLAAEGTKQLQPTAASDQAPLYINASEDAGGERTNFAGWGVADPNSRLYINIQEPLEEYIFIGLGDWERIIGGGRIEYRIVAPNGEIVKEFLMTFPNITGGYAQAVMGPDAIISGGYDTSIHKITPADFAGTNTPNQKGDYYIEFRELNFSNQPVPGAAKEFGVGLYDFTVGKIEGGKMEAIDGRIWSYRWEFRQPEVDFDPSFFDGAFYVCAEDESSANISNDGFVTYIDFEGAGFSPGIFNVIFNNEGPGIGTTPAEKRKSRIGCSQLGTPLHKAYLNDPLDVCITAFFGNPSEIATLEQCGLNSFCWAVTIDKFGGEFDVLLDLNGVAGFQNGSVDVLLTYSVLPGDEVGNICIPWDGLDGQGNFIGLGVDLTMVTTSYLEGIFHFPIFDAEISTSGFEVSYVRPDPGNTLMIKWDDSEVNGMPCATSCDPAGPVCTKAIGGTCVDVELSGCDPTTAGCSRCWPNPYGDRATLNTFWNIYIEELTNVVTPVGYYECSINGAATLCPPNETTDLSVNLVITGDPTNFSWAWSGPNGAVSNGIGMVESDIPTLTDLGVDDAGTYTLTLDFGMACTTTCTATILAGTTPATPEIVGGDLDRDLCADPADPVTIEINSSVGMILYEETFEKDGAGAIAVCEDEAEISTCANYTPPINGQWSLTGTDYGLGTGSNEIDYLVVRGGKLEAMDIDGTLCFETIVIDISTAPSVDFSLELNEDAEDDLESGDNVAVNYSLDGAAFTNVTTLTNDFIGPQTITQNGLIGNSLVIQVCFTNNANHEHYFLDDVVVTESPVYNYYDVNPTTAGATPITTGTSYMPTIDPGTTASIWVTCFNGVCESDPVEVLFNNDCCSLDVTCAATIPNPDFECISSLPAIPASFNDFSVKGDEAAFEGLYAAPNFVIEDDFCGEIVITAADANNGGSGCAGDPLVITRTYTILDDENENGIQDGTEVTTTCAETFTFEDDLPPVFENCVNGTIATPIDRGCNNPSDAASVLLAVGDPSDNCQLSTAPPTVIQGLSVITGCLVTDNWTVIAVDACGTTGTCTVSFTYLSDNTAPTFALCDDGNTANDTISLPCNPLNTPTAADAIGAAGAITEGCDLGMNVPTAALTGSMTVDCVTTESWTVSVSDSCGNVGSCVVNYLYTLDSTPPTFAICTDTDASNDTITLGCNLMDLPTEADAILAAGAITETCGLGTNSATAIKNATETEACITTEEWTVSVTDACGNQGSCTIYFQYAMDAEAPTFALCTDGDPSNNTIDLGCNPTALTEQEVIAAAGAVTENCNLGNNTITAAITNTTTVNCLTTQEWTVSVTDFCGNTGTCIINYTFTIDHDAPVIPCQTSTTLALSGDGSEIHWSAIANNITDNCGVSTVLVKRADTPHCAGDDSSEYASTVPFYCCDVGNTVTVTVQAIDFCGKENSCNVFVTVEDNIAPMISCPADKSIDCDNLDLLDVYDGVTADDDGVEDVSPAGVLTYVINLEDPADPDTVFYGYFDNNLIWDDCGSVLYIWTTGEVNQCGNSVDANGNLLPLQRHYVAVDLSGNVSATCIQEITVSSSTPFDPTTQIVWPAPYMNPGASCGDLIDPGSLPTGSQNPTITSSTNCDDLAVGYTDSPPLYPANPTEGYCYKILRTWNVVDWCSNANYTHNQVIMVVDPGPVFDNCPDTVFVVAGNNLVLNMSAPDLCSGTDAAISYTVDLDENGTIDNNGTTGDIDELTGGVNYPVGVHSITFTATGCTTNTTCEVVVVVSTMAPPSIGFVSGSISNEENEMVENVSVSPAAGIDVAFTDSNGAFGMNLPTSENYNITPTKDIEHLNGVSTYDIVLLSKHILQTEILDSPYKLIAGDVNKSGSISTLDLVELRKVILFINDEFPNNESWRFVDANYAFPNPANPFEEVFPESYSINGLSGDMVNLDFVAVKVGDVNGSASTNGFSGGGEGRDFDGNIDFEIADTRLAAGQTHTIDVIAKDYNKVLGYQFTTDFEGLEILEVIPGEQTDLGMEHFGMQRLSEGILTTSWNTTEAQSLPDGTVLFSLRVKANVDVLLSEVLKVSSHYTHAEAYAEKGNVIELLEVNFSFMDNKTTTIGTVFELYQNRPNPFKEETVIGFDLPQGGTATLTIYDFSGRVLMQVTEDYTKGYHEVAVDRSELPATGVLYYELKTERHAAVRQMRLVE